MSRTVVHDTFIIERRYPASPARVFAAFAEPEARRAWFGNDDELTPASHEVNFHIGGRERIEGDIANGGPHVTYDATFQDIVEQQRIVYSYEMTMNGQRISVSVATNEFVADGDGTLLVVTEQGAYLDGLDTSAMREAGTREILDGLARYLAEGAA